MKVKFETGIGITTIQGKKRITDFFLCCLANMAPTQYIKIELVE